MDELLKKRCGDYLLLPKRQKIRQVYGPKLLNTVQMLCFGKKYFKLLRKVVDHLFFSEKKEK